MKTPSYIVRIPEPCHEDWNSMQPDAKGKFCTSCSKAVFDFSNKTDTEIRDILIQHKDQKVCGHFKKTQVDRPLNFSINLNSLPKNISSTKAFAIAVFLVFGTFLFSCTSPEGKKIGEIEVVQTIEEEFTTTGVIVSPLPELKGDTILDTCIVQGPDSMTGTSTMEPIYNFNETHVAGGLRFEEIIVKNEEPGDTTDIVGDVETKSLLMGLMEIEIEPQDTNITTQDSAFKEVLNGIKDQPIFNKQEPGLLVYPNPGSGEFTIKYDVLKRSGVRIDIFDLNGAWLKTVVNIAGQYEGRYQVPVNLSELPNGIYLVNMINEGKRFTEKVIIEK